MSAILTDRGIKLNCPVCCREIISDQFSVRTLTPLTGKESKPPISINAHIDCGCGAYGRINYRVDAIIKEEEK